MISIIIITKNDPTVYKTVDAISRQKIHHSYEIIIVSSSSTIESFSENRQVRVIPYTVKKNKITIPEQRNAGVKAAKGDVIVFIDANCSPQQNWLINILKPILEKQEAIVAGKTLSETKNSFRNRELIPDSTEYLDEAPTINLAVKKELFNNIGFFDESFEYGSDVDFTWRARDMGYKIAYVSDAVISHNWGNFSTEIVRAFRYGKARCKLYDKYKSNRKYFILKDKVVIVYFLLVPLALLVPLFPILLILYVLIFIKNINKKPIHTLVYNITFGLGMWVYLMSKKIFP